MNKSYEYSNDAFIQEIQEALDEQKNNLDSLLTHNQVNLPFAFESQVDTNTQPMNLSLKSTDESLQLPIESENNISNETVPLLAVPNEKNQSEISHNHRRKSSWTSVKDSFNIKKEAITPVRQVSTSSSSFLNFVLAKNKTTSIKTFN